jgi:SAM-dependent methyltransferase
MEFTGERAMPAKDGYVRQLYLEHVSRYAFASQRVRPGMVVVDAACGVGYGTSILAAQGCHVIGVDIDAEACSEARKATQDQACIILEGNCCALPIEDQSVDAFVCFETIEHVSEQDVLLQEVRRVLKPQGVLVISTPNLAVLNRPDDRSGNPFHVRELTLDEFSTLLHKQFGSVEMYGQVVNPEIVGLLQLERRVNELETIVQRQSRLLWRIGVPTAVRERIVSWLAPPRASGMTVDAVAPLREGSRLTAQAALCAPIGGVPPALSDYLIAVCSWQAAN